MKAITGLSLLVLLAASTGCKGRSTSAPYEAPRLIAEMAQKESLGVNRALVLSGAVDPGHDRAERWHLRMCNGHKPDPVSMANFSTIGITPAEAQKAYDIIKEVYGRYECPIQG